MNGEIITSHKHQKPVILAGSIDPGVNPNNINSHCTQKPDVSGWVLASERGTTLIMS